MMAVVVAAACASASAQDQKPQQPTVPKPAAQPATAPTAQPDPAKRERLLKAVQLPGKANEVRDKGVPDSDVKETLRAGKSKGVKAGEMSDIADEQSKAIDEHGPTDNFGAFVRSKLDQGLRGRDLAAAIREEHAKHGKGKGFGKAKSHHGKSDKGEDHGKPDDHGKPGKGKPGKG